MPKSRELQEMREKLVQIYPRGIIRGQYIWDMPESQVYAIYKSHSGRSIPMNRPRMERNKQIPGQMNLFKEM